MPKKPHPADIAVLAKIAEAAYFTVHLRSGPHDKITKEAKTLMEAIAIRDEMGTTPSGKKAIIYAVGADKMAVDVPTAAIAQAREGGGNIEIATAPPAAAQEARKPRKAVDSGERAKHATAPRVPASGRPVGRRAEIAASAAKGVLPPVPNFTVPTHKPHRKRLEAVVALVDAGDVEGLKAFAINPVSSSPKAIDKYRNLAVIALEARAAQKAAA